MATRSCPIIKAGRNLNLFAFTLEATNDYVNTVTVGVQLAITAGTPPYYTVLVNGQTTNNRLPFVSTNVTVSLGSTDGVYDVNVGLKGYATNATTTWSDYRFTLDRVAPIVTITNPILSGGAATVTKPYLQLQGFANEQLSSVTYDINNALGVVTNVDGFVTDQVFDTNRFDFTTNYFQCYDVPLATNGPNIITVHATDLAGNVTTMNFTATYSAPTTPPTMSLIWPQDGMAISGTSFSVRGLLSDETATVTAQVEDEDSNLNTVEGIVERNGMFWVENLPLADGDNTLTVTATDAAGNVTTTNITVSTSDVVLTIDSTPTGDALYQPCGTVSGTVTPGYSVAINGVAANVDDYGNWTTNIVPLIGQGTATFDAVAYLPEQALASGSRGQALSRAMNSSPAAPTVASTEIEKDPKVVITTYHVTKSGGGRNLTSGEFFSNARTKDYNADYQTNSSGQWGLLRCLGTVDDTYNDSWPNYCNTETFTYWSSTNVGPYFQHYTDSCGNVSDSTNYFDEFTLLTGLPDQDLYWYGDADQTAPQWIFHYFANNVHHQVINGGWAINMAVDARTEMKLLTGGKALINRQNLICLQCGAGEYAQPSIYDAVPDFPWANVTILPIDSSKLRALWKKVGRDGNLWVVLPDNAALDLKLSAPARHYDASARPLKYKMTVAANDGNGHNYDDLSVTNPEFCVGQYVTFGPQWDRDPNGDDTIGTEALWHLPAKFVNEQWQHQQWVITDQFAGTGYWTPYGSVNYRVNSSLLTNQTTSCWFVNGNGGGCGLLLTLHFSNGQSATLSAVGRITIYRPAVPILTSFRLGLRLVMMETHGIWESIISEWWS